MPRDFREALCGTPCWGGKGNGVSHIFENGENRHNNGGFSGAGAAGEQHYAVFHCADDCAALELCIGDAFARFDFIDQPLDIFVSERRAAAVKQVKLVADIFFRIIILAQKNRIAPLYLFAHGLSAFHKALQPVLRRVRINVEHLANARDHFVLGQINMAVLKGVVIAQIPGCGADAQGACF